MQIYYVTYSVWSSKVKMVKGVLSLWAVGLYITGLMFVRDKLSTLRMTSGFFVFFFCIWLSHIIRASFIEKTVLPAWNALTSLFAISWLFDFLDYFWPPRAIPLIYVSALLLTLRCLSCPRLEQAFSLVVRVFQLCSFPNLFWLL